jgi:hypothetical protein
LGEEEEIDLKIGWEGRKRRIDGWERRNRRWEEKRKKRV